VPLDVPLVSYRRSFRLTFGRQLNPGLAGHWPNHQRPICSGIGAGSHERQSSRSPSRIPRLRRMPHKLIYHWCFCLRPWPPRQPLLRPTQLPARPDRDINCKGDYLERWRTAGQVVFYNGTASSEPQSWMRMGSPTLQTSFAATGVFAITAAYGGNQSYAASTSSPLTETVVTPGVTAAVSPVSLTISAGQFRTVGHYHYAHRRLHRHHQPHLRNAAGARYPAPSLRPV